MHRDIIAGGMTSILSFGLWGEYDVLPTYIHTYTYTHTHTHTHTHIYIYIYIYILPKIMICVFFYEIFVLIKSKNINVFLNDTTTIFIIENVV